MVQRSQAQGPLESGEARERARKTEGVGRGGPECVHTGENGLGDTWQEWLLRKIKTKPWEEGRPRK